MSSKLPLPSTRVTVAVLVDCPHEPQFLSDMIGAHSASGATGRASHQARPFTQKGEVQENMALEVAAKWLFPRNYGDTYNAAVLDQLKAWESFCTFNIGRWENPSMPTGDVTPPGCPRAKLHGKAPETLSERPVVTARAAETTCRSQASSTQTASADKKVKQKPVIDLSRMGEEELRSISSKGSSQQPRTSTPVECVHPQLAGTELMKVDASEVPSTSHSSSTGATVRPETKVVSASQAQAQTTGLRHRKGLKTKQRATGQQGVCAMVAKVMESHGVNQEDWEQSQGPDYQVDPLKLPTWVVHPPPGQHLAT